jgi:DNA mismatch endonuclease (patch repair protein)
MVVNYVEHDKDLPGRPDFVVKSRCLAIFVNGCFWHGHNCRKGKRPTSNRPFWNEKIDGNMRRDRAARRKLWKMEWHVVTIWECQLNKATSITRRLARFINGDNACIEVPRTTDLLAAKGLI